MDIKTNICPYCKSSENKIIRTQPDIRFFSNEIFQICRCKNCGLLFTIPNTTMKEISKYYPSSYGAYKEQQDIDNLFLIYASKNLSIISKIVFLFEKIYSRSLYREIHNKSLKNILFIFTNKLIRFLLKISSFFSLILPTYQEFLPYYKNKIDYLHIGSGNVRLFIKLKLLGFNIHNIDINRELCEKYKKHGISSHYGTILEANLPNNKFDVIFLSHVLEHLIHPKEELIKLKNFLKNDGVIVCQFPLYGTSEWNYNKECIFFDVPRHRIHLEKSTVEKFFLECGLKTAKKLYPPYGWGFVFNDLLCSFKKLKKKTPEKLKKKYFLKSFGLSFFKQSGNALFYLTKIEK